MPPPSLTTAAAPGQVASSASGGEADAVAIANGALHPSSATGDARRRGGKKVKVHPAPTATPDAGGAGGAMERRGGGVGGGWWSGRPEWWSASAVASILLRHPAAALFGCGMLLFMGVEYTIPMVPPAAPPLDLGFAATAALHAGIAARPWLNSLLAALNTVFVAMQAAYILWAILAEGRPRAAVAALMMFTCRGALGCATQLPLPAEFLGSGMDFPVGNVSFFLFFSGHVAGAVIAAEDMRRAGRRGLARLYDALNLLQGVRLLACRGHYTIDLAVGVGAGLLFDMLAGRYLDGKNVVDGAAAAPGTGSRCCSCHKALLSQ
ncbi:phosphatidylcholine:diacylglycerol cholinephosphotransferase 1-like [Oryza brachyantha]|uniref:phosphatidylcholine:diacylglycerol cholinephosphotransferase 1-like n=1 Tax=Oryza brachyantha TaxID=4533 RepID=UPI001ADD616D|nr:phosphatidylcholine:diacylglycerol cholinephosphotransferase 1-like [Oryza brachyantha]